MIILLLFYLINIIARNVGAVFEKLGYGNETGVEVFNSICESLANKKFEETRDRSRSGDYSDEKARSISNEMKATLNESEISALTSGSNNDNNSNNIGTIDYRMSIEDFSTAAIEVDDSLIQAIQIVTRKRIFRRLKQRVGNLPITNNNNNNTPSTTQQGNSQDENGVST